MEDNPFERIARVKIIGPPIYLRSEENVKSVLSNIGNIIEVDGSQNWHTIDLSCAFARIITGDKLPINKVVNCLFNGKSYTVGVAECEDVWQPFSKYYESDSEESIHNEVNNGDVEDHELSDSDVDGISETWGHNNQQEVEEGEIIMESELIGENDDARTMGDESPVPAVAEKTRNIETVSPTFNAGGEKSSGKLNSASNLHSNLNINADSTVAPEDSIGPQPVGQVQNILIGPSPIICPILH
ncbi:unnamed protein product [Lactuca virosa]|uniref:DUF4283 domain-containing protein n=1 Tax=Lactuca virosa TaxID=75947 RepID=A0AAU9LJW3_9ASTR|nr:unnamed protein product [Lactuca virosa]